MLLQTLIQNPVAFALIALGLTIALTIHEFAHALLADRLGDPTPRMQGRLTLNPLSHLDPIGTLFLFIAGFGWGKPVMFDPYNLENPKRDAAIISLAGPASNLIIATLLSLLIRFVPTIFGAGTFLFFVLLPIISINVFLAIFNLIPVHPLDGGKILIGILPQGMAIEAEDILNRYGMIILILLIFPFSGNSAIQALLSPIHSVIMNLLLG